MRTSGPRSSTSTRPSTARRTCCASAASPNSGSSCGCGSGRPSGRQNRPACSPLPARKLDSKEGPMTDFRTRVRRRDVLVAPLLTLGSPEVAEIFTLLGFDWVWIAPEHTPLSLEGAQQLVQAVSGRAGTIIRVPWNDPVHIKRTLDLGCDGVIVPQVKTAAEARQAVAAAKYPPTGIRSVGIARAQQ